MNNSELDFSGLNQYSEEEVEKVLASGVSKFLEEGQHEVEITEIDLSKRCMKDPTWINAKITFAGVGNKITNSFLSIPTSKLTYGEKDSSMPLNSFKEFINALQVDEPFHVVLSNMNAFLDQLVGKSLKITLGYQKGSYIIKYVDKDKYVVIDPLGEVMKEDGKEVVFPSKDAARAELQGTGEQKKIADYLTVLVYTRGKEVNKFNLKSSSTTSSKKKSASAWD